MERVELLLPAGNVERLKVAFDFGADAVYLGMKQYSLRSFAGNFDEGELEWALGYAHERGKRLYVVLNVLAMESELPGVEAAAKLLGRLKPDGVVVADPGILRVVRQEAPEVRVHLSTQASVTNSQALAFWASQGVGRVILARELSLDQIQAVTAGANTQTEVFVHGAQCIAYSGRCFLSLHWAGSKRDPRKGSCAQACRWPYRAQIEDRRRPGEWNPVEEDERGSYFFDSKDLCALPVLDRLVATGVSALKVEGRTRSEMYVGVVADVYRTALDVLAAGGREEFVLRQAEWMQELGKLTERGFSLHFLEGEQPGAETYNLAGSGLGNRNDYLGRVAWSDGEWVEVELRNRLLTGERLECRMPGFRCVVTQASRLVRGDIEVPFGRDGERVRFPACGVEVGALVRRSRGQAE